MAVGLDIGSAIGRPERDRKMAHCDVREPRRGVNRVIHTGVIHTERRVM